MNLNFKKGFFRIYCVLYSVWIILVFLQILIESYDNIFLLAMIAPLIITILIYFIYLILRSVILYILEGFKNKWNIEMNFSEGLKRIINVPFWIWIILGILFLIVQPSYFLEWLIIGLIIPVIIRFILFYIINGFFKKWFILR